MASEVRRSERLQVLRVIDRRYGLMMRDWLDADTRHAAGGCNGDAPADPASLTPSLLAMDSALAAGNSGRAISPTFRADAC